MDILPETEIEIGHWLARRGALDAVLNAIPFTTTQRKEIDHNLRQLDEHFAKVNKKVTHCTREVEGGAAICGIALDCHVHDWRQK